MIERDAASTASPTAPDSADPSEICGSSHSSALSETTSPQPWTAQGRWQARHALDQYRAETDRLRVLVDFLSRPIHAPGGAEPDPDILTAYNLAVEAALRGLMRASRPR